MNEKHINEVAQNLFDLTLNAKLVPADLRDALTAMYETGREDGRMSAATEIKEAAEDIFRWPSRK